MEKAMESPSVGGFFVPALEDGERYAGVLLGEDGSPNQHIILLPQEADRLPWKAAVKWATSIGGELPTRREQALLFANLPRQFKPDWYWSNAQRVYHSTYAWYQDFGAGTQGYSNISIKLGARAVRRLIGVTRASGKATPNDSRQTSAPQPTASKP